MFKRKKSPVQEIQRCKIQTQRFIIQEPALDTTKFVLAIVLTYMQVRENDKTRYAGQTCLTYHQISKVSESPRCGQIRSI